MNKMNKDPYEPISILLKNHVISGFSLSVAHMFFFVETHGFVMQKFARICSGVFLQPPLAPFPRGIALRPGEYSDSVVNF